MHRVFTFFVILKVDGINMGVYLRSVVAHITVNSDFDSDMLVDSDSLTMILLF